MKETGIIFSSFSSDMVRAILEGRKTQTRRTRGLEKINGDPDRWLKAIPVSHTNLWRFEGKDGDLLIVKCPFGQVGDRLWVKETWALRKDSQQTMTKSEYERISAALDLPKINIKWKSPLFMPRSESRIILPITGIRAERLWQTTEEDAKAEGVTTLPWWDGEHTLSQESVTSPNFPSCYRNGFANLWDSLNAKRGYPWESNPWVWRIEFNTLTGPVKV